MFFKGSSYIRTCSSLRPRWNRPQAESLFRYSSLNPASCQSVSRQSCEVKSLIRRSAQDLRAIGERLYQIEQEVGKEKFANWLRFELSWSLKAAQRYISFAQEFKDRNLGSISYASNVLLSFIGMSRFRAVRVLQAQKHPKITRLPAANIASEAILADQKARVNLEMGGVPVEVEGVVTSVQLVFRYNGFEGTIQVPIQEAKFLQ